MKKFAIFFVILVMAIFAFSENIVLTDVLNTVSLSRIPVVKLEENGSTVLPGILR